MRFLGVLIFLIIIPDLRSQELPQSKPPTPVTPFVEREEKQFNFYPGGKIEILAGAAGSVRIIGWQKGSIRMEAEKIVYSPDRVKEVIEQNPIRVKWNQTTSSIRTTGPPSLEMEVNLTIYVPQYKTDINAKISQGDFTVESVNGWIEATLLEGSVGAQSTSGYFSVTTHRGDIQVEMSGTRWDGQEFAAATQLGSVNLLLPVNYSAALQLETRDGKISVDFPPQVVDGEPTPPSILIKKTAQFLKAAVGDGGAPIKLFTYSGNVTLSKK
jgi:DUF4097 and DUF4098 domain-containing protein YvlB